MAERRASKSEKFFSAAPLFSYLYANKIRKDFFGGRLLRRKVNGTNENRLSRTRCGYTPVRVTGYDFERNHVENENRTKFESTNKTVNATNVI